MFRKCVSVILSVLMLLSYMQISAFAQTVDTAQTAYSGSCSEGVTYDFDENTGVLIISGSGDMGDYDYSNIPWGSYASDIKSVVIGDGVTNVGEYAFYNCKNLSSVIIPDSVTDIGYYAFSNCVSLSSINIPSGVTSIGESAFYYCSNLLSITVDENNTVYDSRENCNAVIESKTNTLVAGCKNTVIPDSVTCIGNFAFSGCVNLSSIKIPNSVNVIGRCAFSLCVGLNSIAIPDSVTDIGDFVFSGCNNLSSIIIPDSVTSIGAWVFDGCSENLVVYGLEGSYAQSYAQSHNVDFEVMTVPIQGVIVKDDVSSFTLFLNDSLTVEFEIYPEDATEKITLSTDSSNIKIDGHTITALGIGKAEVTASSPSGAACTFDVNVVDVEKIEIKTMPQKTVYDKKQSLDLTGLVLVGELEDGTQLEITEYEYETNFNVLSYGEYTVTLKKNECTVSFKVYVTQGGVSPQLSIATYPQKTEYKVGEELDTSGMVVELVLGTTAKKSITDYTVGGFDNTVFGEQEITVTYGDFSTAFTVNVIQEQQVKIGDVDNDGNVTVMDATVIQRSLASMIILTDEQRIAADVDKSGDVNVIDATTIQKFIAGIIEEL